MCSDTKILLALLLILIQSCTAYYRMDKVVSGTLFAGISVREDLPLEDEAGEAASRVDSLLEAVSSGPVIMNAIRDDETGEMVATDVITASKVTARFRNVAERFGYVTIGFDLTVPSGMLASEWKMEFIPRLTLMEDSLLLSPVYVTGERYRAAQLRGYERYKAFLDSIISDTSEFINVRQLEIFLERHFPRTYAMKTDSSFISEPLAENVFGVSQREALEHYQYHLRRRINSRRRARTEEMYRRYVKDPMTGCGAILDTVLTDVSGDFIYRYDYTFRSRKGLRKVSLALEGNIYEKGKKIISRPMGDALVYYISSLSSLADRTPRYRMIVLERDLYDNTKALIDFRQGSAVIDTLSAENASELRRIRKCIDDVISNEGYEPDSLVITASCSLEGKHDFNRTLSRQRAETMMKYVTELVPAEWKRVVRTASIAEDWDLFAAIVRNDSLLSPSSKKAIEEIVEGDYLPDAAERRLASLPQYRYLREKIYPRLRYVKFDFYMHRRGMVKDTVHTTEPDSVYMRGVEALERLDYKEATSLLRPYRDYNSALAFLSAGYNHSAWDVLEGLGNEDARVCYLKAIALKRLGASEEAAAYYKLSVAANPSMKYRANLDPEMHDIINYTQP